MTSVSLPPKAMAYGIGLYMNYNAGNIDYTKSLQPYTGSIKKSFHVNTFGGGVLFECFTINRGPVDFHYRLKIGGEAVMSLKNKMRDMYRININNLFFFQICHYGIFSFLLGPQAGFNYHQGAEKNRYSGVMISSFNGTISLLSTFVEDNFIIKSGGINLGLSLGFEFAVSERHLIFIQLGGEQNIYFSKFAIRGAQFILNPPPLMPPINGYNESHNRLKVNFGTEGLISVGFLYKIS